MNATVLQEVLAGLTDEPKHLSPKFFYDARGSKLFEEITRTAEYYPTNCELEILAEQAGAIGQALGPDLVLVELGSGSSLKVRQLLAALTSVRAYVPVDISKSALQQSVDELKASHPALTVRPVATDYTKPFELPPLDPAARWVMFYPGSTIGNLDPAEAQAFLARISAALRPGDALLIGYDLVKDKAVLEAAYNDAAGVTAAFNLNMLTHLNRTVGTDFDVSCFEHLAFFNDEASRIEMHLRSTVDQVVTVGDTAVHFAAGELLHTESSYKYDRARFGQMADKVDLREEGFWTDRRGYFGVALHTRPAS